MPNSFIRLSSRALLTFNGLLNSPVRLFFRYLGKPHVIASIMRSPAFSRTMKPVPPFHTSPVLAFVGFGPRALKWDAPASTDALRLICLHTSGSSTLKNGRAHVLTPVTNTHSEYSFMPA